jgi:hypothetical protein
MRKVRIENLAKGTFFHGFTWVGSYFNNKTVKKGSNIDFSQQPLAASHFGQQQSIHWVIIGRIDVYCCLFQWYRSAMLLSSRVYSSRRNSKRFTLGKSDKSLMTRMSPNTLSQHSNIKKSSVQELRLAHNTFPSTAEQQLMPALATV